MTNWNRDNYLTAKNARTYLTRTRLWCAQKCFYKLETVSVIFTVLKKNKKKEKLYEFVFFVFQISFTVGQRTPRVCKAPNSNRPVCDTKFRSVYKLRIYTWVEYTALTREPMTLIVGFACTNGWRVARFYANFD